MKKTIGIAVALLASFGFGFACKAYMATQATSDAHTRKVTGIGGIFFKSKEPKKMREWYRVHLGLTTNQYGAVFAWHQGLDSTKRGFSQWSVFSEKTKYFEPSTKEFMINYRVENMTELVAQLKREGVTITDTIESVSYGKFVHVMDIEGNKIELWEANDIEYSKMTGEVTQ
jgi:predicted enzyme related to lactoylglutathione lyase